MLTVREVLINLLPPIIVKIYQKFRKWRSIEVPASEPIRLALIGNYATWSEAEANSAGYDSDIILEKTIAALGKVKRGEAVYERDSMLFDEVQYAWPVLAGLLWVAARSAGRLNVLDFGGSLGSTWFQNRAFLRKLDAVRWNIVEQPRQVAAGRREFQDDQLRFFGSVDECLAESQPNVILLSSVLQYLEQPYDLLEALGSTPCQFLIIDRTPFWTGSADRLCVQQVPAEIYPASYPSWIFSQQRFRAILSLHWQVIAEFENPDRLPGPVPVSYRGLIAARQIGLDVA